MFKSILIHNRVQWRLRCRINLAMALALVSVVASQPQPPTPQMEPTAMGSCHEKCAACKSAHSEWRIGDISKNPFCKLCNECYERNQETILNNRRNMITKNTASHFEKFIMISNEEQVYPEGCPRPPACPEDYSWETLKHCPPLPPCNRLRRALEKLSENLTTTAARPRTLSTNSSPVNRTTAVSSKTKSQPTTTAPTNESMKKPILRPTIRNILSEGDIFLLKNVYKHKTTTRRTLKSSQTLVKDRTTRHKTMQSITKTVQIKKRDPIAVKHFKRSGDTTPCNTSEIDPQLFDDAQYDHENQPPEKEHAFRPNEFRDYMQTSVYRTMNNSEDSDETHEISHAKKPNPKSISAVHRVSNDDDVPQIPDMMHEAHEPAEEEPSYPEDTPQPQLPDIMQEDSPLTAATVSIQTTEISQSQTTEIAQQQKTEIAQYQTTESASIETTVSIPIQTEATTPIETTILFKKFGTQPHFVDYVTFPPSSENTSPNMQNFQNFPNCCPSCVCSMPMCMMGACFNGAQQNGYNSEPPPIYPQYLEIDEEFAKSATGPPSTKSTIFPYLRNKLRNRARNKERNRVHSAYVGIPII